MFELVRAARKHDLSVAFRVFTTNYTTMKPRKSVQIIGAGIAGLSAGIYARMNGFDTTIFEAGDKVGGVCTSWDRGGYHVNGSIHWLVGSAPGSDLHRLWHQLGVIEGNTFHQHESFLEYYDIEGTNIHFYTDPARLYAHWTAISPADAERIGELREAIETLASDELPMDKAFELLNIWDWTRLAAMHFPFILTMTRYTRVTVWDFAQRFESAALRRALEHFWHPDMSMAFLLMQWAYAAKGSAGYPLGGSGKFVERMEKRYRELGGRIMFDHPIQKILVVDGQAQGVQTKDGQRFLADYVISACDGHTTLFKLLGDEWTDEKTRESYRKLEPFPSLVYFSAGINRLFDGLPSSIMGYNIPLLDPLHVGQHIHTRVSFQIYHFDPTLAPAGKTLITAMLDTDYVSWKALYEHSNLYREERHRICAALMAALEKYFPGITQQTEFMDTATPVTYERWTGNH